MVERHDLEVFLRMVRMRKLSKLLALLFFAPLAFAQGPPPNLSKTAGVYVVSPYSQWTDQIAVGNATTGAGSTIVLTSGSVLLPDNRRIVPFATTVPLLVDVGTSAETVTPTAVSGCSASSSGPCTITANFTKLHQVYATVFSGTSGVQDAINDASSQTAAIVVMDLSSQPNPTTPTPSNIAIFDYRTAGAPLYWAGGSSSGAAWGSSGSGATPCITTALSLQFNSAGSLGCEPDLTFTAPHTLALGASGIFNVAGTLGLTNATSFLVPTSAGFASSATVHLGIDSTLNNAHIWNGAVDLISFGVAPGVATSGHIVGYAVNSGNVVASDLGAPAGGGASFLKCTTNGLAVGDYFGVNGSNICAELTPGLTPNNITASGTTILPSTYRGQLITAGSTSGAQTFALTDGSSAGFTGSFYERICNFGTVGALSLTNNGGAYTFNGAASPYSLPEGYCASVSNNVSSTGWLVDASPGTIAAGSNITVTQSQYGTTIASTSTSTPPCTTTANSFQFDNGGAFGCATPFTFASNTITSAAAGILDMSAATGTAALKVPVAAGETATANGSINFDSTNKNFHGYVNAADSIFANFAAAPTTNVLPKATIASGNTLLTNSLLTDNGTTGTYTGTGGLAAPVFAATGTTAGFMDLAAGSTSAAVSPCNAANSACWQAPAAVTAYVMDIPGAAPANNFSSLSCSDANPSICSFAKQPQTVMLTSQYTNSTTSFTNVTGTNSLAFSLEANTTYQGTCTLYYQAASTGGLNIEFTGPASPTFVTYGLLDPGSATTIVNASVATAFSTSLGAAVTTATTNFPATVTFGISNGANAGTLQMLAKSSAAVSLQIQTGSYCVMQ